MCGFEAKPQTIWDAFAMALYGLIAHIYCRLHHSNTCSHIPSHVRYCWWCIWSMISTWTLACRHWVLWVSCSFSSGWMTRYPRPSLYTPTDLQNLPEMRKSQEELTPWSYDWNYTAKLLSQWNCQRTLHFRGTPKHSCRGLVSKMPPIPCLCIQRCRSWRSSRLCQHLGF